MDRMQSSLAWLTLGSALIVIPILLAFGLVWLRFSEPGLALVAGVVVSGFGGVLIVGARLTKEPVPEDSYIILLFGLSFSLGAGLGWLCV